MSVQETAGKQIEEAVAATVARIATETADQVRGKPEAAETLQKDSAEATEEGAQKTAEDVNEGQGVAAGVESEGDEPAAEPVPLPNQQFWGVPPQRGKGTIETRWVCARLRFYWF